MGGLLADVTEPSKMNTEVAEDCQGAGTVICERIGYISFLASPQEAELPGFTPWCRWVLAVVILSGRASLISALLCTYGGLRLARITLCLIYGAGLLV